MPVLAALVLLASSTVRIEDALNPGTMICTCTPAANAAPSPVQEVSESAPPRVSTWGIAAGATALALFGGSYAAHVYSNNLTSGMGARSPSEVESLQGNASRWNTASTAMAIGGAALAGFTAAFFLLKF